MQAMLAGQAAGGEEGPVHSAGLLVYADQNWPIVGLRLDWVELDPVQPSTPPGRSTNRSCRPTSRRLDPRAAPSFGVPGDL